MHSYSQGIIIHSYSQGIIIHSYSQGILTMHGFMQKHHIHGIMVKWGGGWGGMVVGAGSGAVQMLAAVDCCI